MLSWRLEERVLSGLKVLQDLREIPETWDPKVLWARLACRGLLVQLALKGLRVTLERMVLLAQPEARAQQDFKAHLALPDRKDRKALKVCKETLVQKERLALKDRRDRQVPQELLALRDHKVFKASRVFKVRRGQKATLATPDRQELTVGQD